MLSAALLLAATAISAPLLAPIDKWTVDYGDARCVVTRRFGDEAHAVTFAFDSLLGELGGPFFLIAEGRSRAIRDGKARVTLDNGGTFSMPWVATPAGKTTRVFRMHADDAFWATLPNATTMQVEDIEGEPFALPIGSIAKVAASVKACGDNLVRSWGADPDAMVLVNPIETVEWISADDYPAAALKAKQTGTVTTLTTIGPDGAPIACRAVETSGHPPLDEASCRIIMNKARFATATTPVRYFLRSVTWSLPTVLGPPPTIYIPG